MLTTKAVGAPGYGTTQSGGTCSRFQPGPRLRAGITSLSTIQLRANPSESETLMNL